MACGSCGSSSRRVQRSMGGSWSRASVTADPQEWVVTYPSGKQEIFYDDTSAYREVRRHGGGVQQRART